MFELIAICNILFWQLEVAHVNVEVKQSLHLNVKHWKTLLTIVTRIIALVIKSDNPAAIVACLLLPMNWISL